MKFFNPKNKIYFQVKVFSFKVHNFKGKNKKKWLIIKKHNRKISTINKQFRYSKYKRKGVANFYIKKHLRKFFPLLENKKNTYLNCLNYLKTGTNIKNILLCLYFKKNIRQVLKKIFKVRYIKNSKNDEIVVQGKIIQRFISRKIRKSSFRLLRIFRSNNKLYQHTLYLHQLTKNLNGRITKKRFKSIARTFFLIKKKYKIIFFVFLDSSINNYLVISGLAKSIFEARQLIIHNKVTINNNSIQSCFIFLKPGDMFGLKANYNRPIKERLPVNLLYNKHFKCFIFVRYRSVKEILYPFKLDTHLLEYTVKAK